jgi:hypothetical protein
LFQALLDPARKNNTSPQLQPPRPNPNNHQASKLLRNWVGVGACCCC